MSWSVRLRRMRRLSRSDSNCGGREKIRPTRQVAETRLRTSRDTHHIRLADGKFGRWEWRGSYARAYGQATRAKRDPTTRATRRPRRTWPSAALSCSERAGSAAAAIRTARASCDGGSAVPPALCTAHSSMVGVTAAVSTASAVAWHRGRWSLFRESAGNGHPLTTVCGCQRCR